MDSNLAGTFDDSFITDSNYQKWKLVIFVEIFRFQIFATTAKCRNDQKNTAGIQICNFSLIVLTKVNHF
jgi:hypothetical protein